VAGPAHFLALDSFARGGHDLSRAARLCLSAAGPLPVEVKEAFERETRARLLEGYGAIEAGLVTLDQPLKERRTGTVGLPLPGTETRIVDLAGGAPAPPGAIGELLVRGPQVMLGYADEPAPQRGASMGVDGEGWLHTGDLARLDDDGYVQVLGRRQDLWRAGDGALVIARDVEEAIIELPEVREVAVVARGGQPVAYVGLHAGETVAAEVLLDFCRRRLPASHVPRQVVFVEGLPRNFMGQVLRDSIPL